MCSEEHASKKPGEHFLALVNIFNGISCFIDIKSYTKSSYTDFSGLKLELFDAKGCFMHYAAPSGRWSFKQRKF